MFGDVFHIVDTMLNPTRDVWGLCFVACVAWTRSALALVMGRFTCRRRSSSQATFTSHVGAVGSTVSVCMIFGLISVVKRENLTFQCLKLRG